VPCCYGRRIRRRDLLPVLDTLPRYVVDLFKIGLKAARVRRRLLEDISDYISSKLQCLVGPDHAVSDGVHLAREELDCLLEPRKFLVVCLDQRPSPFCRQ